MFSRQNRKVLNCFFESISQDREILSYDCLADFNKSQLIVENQNMKVKMEALVRLIANENLRANFVKGGLKEAESFTPYKIKDL